MLKTKNPIFSAGIVRLWLVLAVAAFGSLADVMEYSVRQNGVSLAVAGLSCAALFKASALTILYVCCRKKVWLRSIAMAVIAIFVFLSLLSGGCRLLFGFGMSRKLLTIIAETNSVEVGEFMPELGERLLSLVRSPWLWGGLSLFVAGWIWLPRVSRKWFLRVVGILSALGLAYLAIVFITADFGRTDHSIFARSGRCVTSYMRDRKEIRELLDKKRALPERETLFSTHAAKRIVVVIGESASRDHLSLYGYPLSTSPRIDSISAGLFRFDDAVASSTSTAQNMPRLLSFMTDEPGAKEWYEYPSLLQVFKGLGYRTYWLSNQEYSGKWSNLSSILAADADVVKYVGSVDSEDHYAYKYDDVLLPELKEALASGDSLQLIFLHLMGSHFQYHNRFPESRRHFTADDVAEMVPANRLDSKKAAIVADYDNSILYTDSILGEVMKSIEYGDKETVVVYLSDHGENVYDNGDYRGRDPEYVAVPFVVFANNSYRDRNPDMITDMEHARSNTFSTSELPQFLLHLSGSRYHSYDSVRDPLSVYFRPRMRFVDDEPFQGRKK